MYQYYVSPEWSSPFESPVPEEEPSNPNRVPSYVSITEIMDGTADNTLSEVSGDSLFRDSGQARSILQRVADILVHYRAAQFELRLPDNISYTFYVDNASDPTRG